MEDPKIAAIKKENKTYTQAELVQNILSDPEDPFIKILEERAHMVKEETLNEKAVRLVCEYLDTLEHGEYGYDEDSIRLVWFTKTLKNWKAMVANIGDGGNFYEVTYNGAKKETYIDEYKKTSNTVVKD